MAREVNAGFRPEIQALRAVAVAAVMINHLWPALVSGGYVGVDVFFVVSGYLITSHLLREMEDGSSISLLSFWGRRIARLIPAASLVLLVTLVGIFLVMYPTAWTQNVREVIASSLYVENWILIASSVNYLDAESVPSVAQHYWSLSVEEQFYIVWPLLMIGALWIFRRLRRRYGVAQSSSARMAVLPVVIGIVLLGLIACVIWTRLSPASAYFATPVRMWQFGAGALLCFAPRLRPDSGLTRAVHHVASWSGVVLIVAACIFFDESLAYPGMWALVPTAGTFLVIYAGMSESKWSPVWLARFAPVQYTGDISYSLYLWHWPLIVLSTTYLGHALGLKAGAAVLLVTFVLAAFTKRFVEDPFRSLVFWRPRLRKFGLGATSMVLVAGSGAIALVVVSSMAAAAATPKAPYATVAELQRDVAETLAQRSFAFPDQVAGRSAQAKEWIDDNCVTVDDAASQGRCVYGDKTSSQVMVVIGDSYATQIMPALREAFDRNWRIEVRTFAQCPISVVDVTALTFERGSTTCADHNEENVAYLKKAKPDLVIVAEATHSAINRVIGVQTFKAKLAQFQAGLRDGYEPIANLGLPTVVVEGPPGANCVGSSANSHPSQCVTDEQTKQVDVLQNDKGAFVESLGMGYVYLTPWVCSESLVCPDQIGSRLMRADGLHFTDSFSRSIGKILGEAILSTEPGRAIID